MTENKTDTLIQQLQNTLRTKSGQGNWFFLEPIDETLLESIEKALVDSEVSSTEVSNVPQTANLLKSALQSNTRPTSTTNMEISPNPAPTDQVLQPANQNEWDPMNAGTLDSMRLRLRDCTRCDLCTDRLKVVFGQGNIRADLVFVGEGPGADEDKSGIAFVGKAGKLLTQMIQSIGINREAVFICNVVKCRPPGNRNPTDKEIASCSPFLFKQLEILNPKLIVTMGNIATKTLLPQAYGIMKMRGRLTAFQGTPLLPTFHPSYLLRNPSALGLVWNDMKQIRQIMFK